MNEEKRKTENSTDQKVSVFPESRELLTYFERHTDALFACRSSFTAETDRNLRAAKKFSLKKKKKSFVLRVSLAQMLFRAESWGKKISCEKDRATQHTCGFNSSVQNISEPTESKTL